MRFQSSQASCGLAAIRNALLCLGIERSEDELASLTNYTPAEGTDQKGILRALANISKTHPSVTPGVLAETREDVAMLRLEGALRHGRPVIMCVDDWEHWVTAFGLLGGTVHVCDSAYNELVYHYAGQELARRWKHSASRKAFYGIIL